MAKKIKFALKMKDGAEVRDIESLREHFDADTVVGYFLDGRLLTWLGNFYYDTEADLVEKLDKNDGQLKKKLCEIFDVEYEDDGEFDVELAAKRREKLEKLKQYTADEKILALVDNVAFDRSDMVELLDEDADTIVLVDGTYRIPLREHNKKYIGVGNVVAEINSKEVVDFDEIGIKFENIRFDDEYAALLNVNPVEDFRRLYDEAKEADDREKMLKYALKCAESGEADMMIVVGDEYFGRDEEDKAFEWYMKAAQKNNTDGMFCVGECYSGGMGVEADEAKAVEWYKKGADLQDVYCVNALAKCYRNGIGVPINIDQAIDLYNSILYNGVANKELGDIYRLEDDYIDYEKAIQCYLKAVEIDENDGYSMNAIGLLLDDEHESFEWFLKSAEAGYCWGMYNVACRYYYGNGVGEDDAKAIPWFEKAAETGISEAMAKLGDIYRCGNGVKVDGKRAAEWYNNAIESGDTTGAAYCGLGNLMESGMIPSKGTWEKFQHFKKSAEAGYAWGMYKLGNCYLDGDGTSEDIDKGMEWIQQAADAGLEIARDFVTDIENASRIPDRTAIYDTNVMAELIWRLNEVSPAGDSSHTMHFRYDNTLSENLINICQDGVYSIEKDEIFIAIGVTHGSYNNEYMVFSNKAIYRYENPTSWSRVPYNGIKYPSPGYVFAVYDYKDEMTTISFNFPNTFALGNVFVVLMAGLEFKRDVDKMLLYDMKLESLNGFSVGEVLWGEQ